ncbi:MAG: pseudouridine synthase [Vicingaceae bacterium]
MHHYFAVHKPYGYLSQFKNNQRRKKPLLQELHDFPEGIMAVGRLDAKSEGLLLLTTNGKWSHYLRSKKFEKEYYVELGGVPSEESIEKLRKGVNISIEGKTYATLPAKVSCILKPSLKFIEDRQVRKKQHGPTSWLNITIKEGKFRQVRKMTAAVGHPTLRLIRMRFAEFQLDPLIEGQVRPLSQSELNKIEGFACQS